MLKMPARVVGGGKKNIGIDYEHPTGASSRVGSVQSARLPGGSASQLMWSLEKHDFDSISLPQEKGSKSNGWVNAQTSGAIGSTMRAPPAYWRKALAANIKSEINACPQTSQTCCPAASSGCGLRSRKQNLASIRDIERRASNVDFFYGTDDDRLSSDVPFVAHVASLLRSSCNETPEDEGTWRPAGGKQTPGRRPASGAPESRKVGMSSSFGVSVEHVQRQQHFDDRGLADTEEIIERVIPRTLGNTAEIQAGSESLNIAQAWARGVLVSNEVDAHTPPSIWERFSVTSPKGQDIGMSRIDRPSSGSSGHPCRPSSLHGNRPSRGDSAMSARKARQPRYVA